MKKSEIIQIASGGCILKKNYIYEENENGELTRMFFLNSNSKLMKLNNKSNLFRFQKIIYKLKKKIYYKKQKNS